MASAAAHLLLANAASVSALLPLAEMVFASARPVLVKTASASAHLLQAGAAAESALLLLVALVNCWTLLPKMVAAASAVHWTLLLIPALMALILAVSCCVSSVRMRVCFPLRLGAHRPLVSVLIDVASHPTNHVLRDC